MSQPILILLAAVFGLLVLAVLVLAVVILRDRRAAARRVESLFRRPLKDPKKPGPDHYYKPYWS